MATVRNQIGNERDAGGVSTEVNKKVNLMKNRADLGRSGKPYPHGKDSAKMNTKVPQLFKKLKDISLAKTPKAVFSPKTVPSTINMKASHDQHMPRLGKGGMFRITPSTKGLNKGVTVGNPKSVPLPSKSFVGAPGWDNGGGQVRKNPGTVKGMIPLFKPQMNDVTKGLSKGYPKAPFSKDTNWGKAVFQGKGNGQRFPQPGSRPKGTLPPKNTDMPSNFKGSAPGNPKGY